MSRSPALLLVTVFCKAAFGQLDLCVDHISSCEAYGVSVCHGTYEEWAHQNCRNYCGYCSKTIAVPSIGPLAPTPGTCKDNIQTCRQYGKSSCQGQFMTWARQNCADYCGFCSHGSTQSHQPGTNADGCLYKNHVYMEGQTFEDGCLYTCTCLDGQTGYYKCQSKCPTHTDLPQNCTVVKQAGECCGKVICTDAQVVVHTVSGTGNSTLPPELAGCTYKGVVHKTGDNWDDGCNFRCSCTNGAIGLYKCSTRCIQWSLPKECRLVPAAAGKCCPTPKCPAGYHIHFPPGYQP